MLWHLRPHFIYDDFLENHIGQSNEQERKMSLSQHEKLWQALGVRTSDSALDTMKESQRSDRQAIVLRSRFGLQTGRSRTLKDVSLQIGLSAERTRQIEGEALPRIHRRTALGTALEEASGCSSESGIMVLEQKPARKQGAPNRCCHRTNPTVSASSLTTIAWWPMPACSCRPPQPGTWACGNSSTITLTSAERRDGRTLGTRC